MVAWPPCRLVGVHDECKRDLIVSRTLLVLERKILKSNGDLVQYGRLATVQSGKGVGRVQETS